MGVLAADGLQEGYGRQIASVESGEKVVDVVLMIRRVGEPNATYRAWTQMVGISRRGIILERLVMGYVVAFVHAGYRRGSIAFTTGRTVGGDGIQIESTLEPAPGNIPAVEESTDVWSTQLNFVSSRGRAHVIDRVGIANKRQTAIAIANPVT